MIQMLVAMVGKLTHEVAHLKSDNVEFKKQISNLKVLAVGPTEPSTTGRRKQLVSVEPFPSLPKSYREDVSRPVAVSAICDC
jgi:hypothetical protein